ncbi:MAG: flavodoxin family protein [Deltaproteobacteria bacterium]|jgi:multimeric flavodoxin WrbA|nr:flavodoxin family protein [Deltaproteobacteria bacterium]
MAVLAVNGSPRKGGNTSIMLEWCLEELRREGFQTEVFQVGGQAVRGCKACGGCSTMKEYRCVQDDEINKVIVKAPEAEALILASPVYFSDITPELKATIDRVGYVDLHHGNLLRRKPGAGIVVARRAGHVHSYDSINHLFGILQMVTVGSRYWNLGVAREAGAVKDDREAEETMRILGSNMAWLLKRLQD